MKTILLDSFRRYIEAQHTLAKTHPKTQRPAITISRQTGAGAVTIGHLVAKILDDRSSAACFPCSTRRAP